MAIEPTLGDLIRSHIARVYLFYDRRATLPTSAEVDALCARADAAERLAVVVGAADLRGLSCAHLGVARKGRVEVDEGEWRRLNAAVGSIVEALAAWRAITEGVQP